MKSEKDIKEMEFEDALKELEGIVRLLEEGKASLKESVELFERGTLLKKHCDSILESAQIKISKISSGKITPMGVEESAPTAA
jgi:exodeoxyribonuclease VII small subunit